MVTFWRGSTMTFVLPKITGQDQMPRCFILKATYYALHTHTQTWERLASIFLFNSLVIKTVRSGRKQWIWGSLLWHVGRDKLFLKSTDLRGGFIQRVRGVLCTHLIHAETFKLKAVAFQPLQKHVFAKQCEGFQPALWCDNPGVKITLNKKHACESTHL